ncbi:MAG: flagellar assembly protein FliW [Treponema sp.]|nr:flagellar assembly protein FliW [Treponema sp.]
MDVRTKSGTTIQVQGKDLLEIPEGLFGFEEYKNYAIYESEFPPFMWMQSTDESSLAFLIVDPFLVAEDYELDVDDKALAKIGISNPAEVCVMAIVTIPAGGTPVTANLQGPLVINRSNNKAMQVILNSNKWTTKHDIMKALKAKDARGDA